MLSLIVPIGPGRTGSTALDSLARVRGCETIVVLDGGAISDAELTETKIIQNASDSGPGSARNAGLAACSGDLVAFLDDDDAFLAGAVEAITATAARYPEISAFAFSAVDLAGRAINGTRRFRLRTKRDILRRNHLGGCSTMVMRRVLLETCGGFDPGFPSMQDWDLWLRATDHSAVLQSPVATVHYDNASGGRISTNLSKRIIGLEMLLHKHAAAFPKPVRAFHLARIGYYRYLKREGRLCDVLQGGAPLASGYYFAKAMSGSRQR